MPSRSAPSAPLRRLVPGALLALAGALFGAPAQAHDFWIEPSSYTPEPGQAVGLRLRVGQHFLGDPLPRDPALLRRFVAVGGGGRERPVPGVDGADPAGIIRPEVPGEALVIGYESGPSEVEMEPKLVAVYFEEEGLDRLAAERRERGETGGVHDSFSRHVKSLLAVGGRPAPGFDRVLGFEIELVPEADPYALDGGGRLPVRLLASGEPATGIRVTAIPRSHPSDVVLATTDDEGRVTLDLAPDVWLIKAVQVVRTGGGSETGAPPSYRSRWASLTFRLPAAAASGAP